MKHQQTFFLMIRRLLKAGDNVKTQFRKYMFDFTVFCCKMVIVFCIYPLTTVWDLQLFKVSITSRIGRQASAGP